MAPVLVIQSATATPSSLSITANLGIFAAYYYQTVWDINVTIGGTTYNKLGFTWSNNVGGVSTGTFLWSEFTPIPTPATNDAISVVIVYDGFSYSDPYIISGSGAPCFVASSKLLTPTGYCAAEDIKTGDLLMTADGRQVPVKSYHFTVEVTNKESAPFFIPKNSISMGCPKADLRLSPWHAFQMKKGLWMKPMSAFELGMPIQQYDLGKSVTYYHFEAPDFFKDNFICEGTVVESFGGFQTKDMKGRLYTYNTNLKGYTRVAAKSVSKAILM